MNLSNIPTPLTDAESARVRANCEELTEPISADFARDLERKLAESVADAKASEMMLRQVCEERDQLRSYTGSQTFRSDFRTADELRAAYDAERAKNAVLREALEKAVRAMEWYAWHKEEDHDCMEYRAVTAARAALAATEEFSSATTTCEHSGITFPTRP